MIVMIRSCEVAGNSSLTCSLKNEMTTRCVPNLDSQVRYTAAIKYTLYTVFALVSVIAQPFPKLISRSVISRYNHKYRLCSSHSRSRLRQPRAVAAYTSGRGVRLRPEPSIEYRQTAAAWRYSRRVYRYWRWHLMPQTMTIADARPRIARDHSQSLSTPSHKRT